MALPGSTQTFEIVLVLLEFSFSCVDNAFRFCLLCLHRVFRRAVPVLLVFHAPSIDAG